ncbi:MAG TPA: flagellar basal body L-ring protein FlgH [Fimbriimonadaceae bacterium]|jgi:flagellar L-ring protein precursor FlgH
MKLGLILALCALSAVAFCQQATTTSLNQQNPGSLYGSGSNGGDTLHDVTACKEGDLITVIITESTAASFNATTTTTRADSASINKGIGPVLGNLIPGLGVGDAQTSTGTGATTQAGSFTGTVSAVVKKVFPNGTMLIEGTRDIVYNKDTQTIRLSGIIRREDITPTNTIFSSQMANASIKAAGKGQISDRQRKGLLVRMLDWLF